MPEIGRTIVSAFIIVYFSTELKTGSGLWVLTAVSSMRTIEFCECSNIASEGNTDF